MKAISNENVKAILILIAVISMRNIDWWKWRNDQWRKWHQTNVSMKINENINENERSNLKILNNQWNK